MSEGTILDNDEMTILSDLNLSQTSLKSGIKIICINWDGENFILIFMMTNEIQHVRVMLLVFIGLLIPSRPIPLTKTIFKSCNFCFFGFISKIVDFAVKNNFLTRNKTMDTQIRISINLYGV